MVPLKIGVLEPGQKARTNESKILYLSSLSIPLEKPLIAIVFND